MSSADGSDPPASRRADARHILTFAAILFAASFGLGIFEGFLKAGVDIARHRAMYDWVGHLFQVVVAMFVFRCMTSRRPANAFPLATMALLAEQLIGLCVALLLMLAWPSLSAPDLTLAAVGLAVKFAGMMLGVAWGLHALRNP